MINPNAMKNRRHVILFLIFLMLGEYARAQDPKLPGGNFGFNNIGAGRWSAPGWYYVQYLQVYSNTSTRDGRGDRIPGPKLTSIVTLQQLIFISKLKLLNGNVAFNALLPLVTTSASQDKPVNINPNPLGDLLVGPYIEWNDQKLLGIDMFYRLGVNVSFPTGSFNERFDYNPGLHRYRFFPHFELTAVPVARFAISIKNNMYFYTREIGSPKKTGTAYNLNYALEYTLVNRLIIGVVGYYLTQLTQDSYHGDQNYYRNNYGISETKERVFAAGPGIGYTTRNKLSLELKAMWETGAVNRRQGFRSTMVLAFPL